MGSKRNPFAPEFGENVLAYLRAEHNLSQAELAEMCGMSSVQVGRFERKQQIMIANAKKIAKVFNISVDALVRNSFDELDKEFKQSKSFPKNVPTVMGCEYYRCKKRMSKVELAERSGVQYSTFDSWVSECKVDKTYSSYLVKVADALGVTVDQLLEVHAVSELDDGDWAVRIKNKGNPNNCLAVYCRMKNLTYERLGKRMGGVTREWARKCCNENMPRDKEIELLAAYEGITPSEFRMLYSSWRDSDGTV